MSSMDRPDAIPGSETTTTRPPAPAGGPPIASPPPETAGAADPRGGAGAGGSRNPADTGREVAGHARSEVEEATGHAVEEGRQVAETAKSEVRDVVDEARDALRQQADRQSHVAADALGHLRDDLQSMSHGEAPRPATADYLERAARSLDGVVERLEQDGIDGALSGVRSFAQRSPGTFLLASAGAGFAVGRILRNADHPQQVSEEQSGERGTRAPTGGPGREINLTDEGMDPMFTGQGIENRPPVERGVAR
jgi:hypothetical protein